MSQGLARADEDSAPSAEPVTPAAVQQIGDPSEAEARAAAERWERLKQAEAAAASRSTARLPRKTPVVIPDDLWNEQASPIGPAAGDPDWVKAALPPNIDEEEPAHAESSAVIAPDTGHAPVDAPQVPRAGSGWTPRKTSEPTLSEPVTTEVVPASAQMHSIVWPLLGLQDPRRKLRPITDISPHYDTQVDKEIRDYAEEQAASYGLKFSDVEYTPRAFPDMMMPWQASNFYHYPLYFEDPTLERYGHTPGFLVQPFASAARFSGQLVLLPYQMTIDPILKPTYTLGWYRPGDVAPKLRYQIPWNFKAAVVEAGVVTGLVFLIP